MTEETGRILGQEFPLTIGTQNWGVSCRRPGDVHVIEVSDQQRDYMIMLHEAGLDHQQQMWSTGAEVTLRSMHALDIITLLSG